MRKFLAVFALVGIVGCSTQAKINVTSAAAGTYTAANTAYNVLCQHQTTLPPYCAEYYQALTVAYQALEAYYTAEKAGGSIPASAITNLNNAIVALNALLATHAAPPVAH